MHSRVAHRAGASTGRRLGPAARAICPRWFPHPCYHHSCHEAEIAAGGWGSDSAGAVRVELLHEGAEAARIESSKAFAKDPTQFMTLIPTVYNADTLGIRPDLIKRPITSWAELLNPEFKGKAAILNIPSIGIIMVIAGVALWIDVKRHTGRFLPAGVGLLIVLTLSTLAYRQSLVWTDTRSLFENVIKLYPASSHVAHNNLGNMYRLEGDLPSAITEYNLALAIRPHAKTYTNLGAAYRKEKDVASALAAYSKALELDEKSTYAHFGLGIVYAQMGALDKAEAQYQRAIALDPTYEEVHVNLGALYAAQERYDDAASEYRKALAINPYYPQAMYNLAVAYEALGKTDDAIDAYRQTISFDPTMLPPRINVALLLYNKKGDRQGAIDQFHAILKINPNNATAKDALRQMGE